MAGRVDVIVNRCASRLVSDGGTRARLLKAARGKAHVHETRSIAELGEVVGSIAERGTDALILAGGDGSYMAGATALYAAFGDAMPRVGFAPGGTVCTVARNWGLSGREGTYAARIVSAAASGSAQVSRKPTLRVRDDRGGDRIGFIFGAGLVASFFETYYAGDRLGYGAAAGIVAEVFAGSFYGGRLADRILKPVPCTLTVDGEARSPQSYSLVAASVVRNLGLHMLVLYRAAERSDRFHVVASPLPARALGPQLPLVLLGRRLRGRAHVDELAGEVELVFSDGGGAYVLDGEVIRASRVRLTAGPILDYLSV